jgi:hypothetical protein
METPDALKIEEGFPHRRLIVQYKQQVLSFIEYRTPAIYHSTKTVLSRLDKLLDNFLREPSTTKEAALLDFNLAPLSTRRDIALLGLLHRAAIGEGPAHFREYFQRRAGSLKLVDPLATRKVCPLLQRSIWGLVRVYNTLGEAATCGTVKDFQRLLQARIVSIIEKRLLPEAEWETLYCPRWTRG